MTQLPSDDSPDDETILPTDEQALEAESKEVDDVVEDDGEGLPDHYEITAYGGDWEAESIVRRLEKGKLFVPDFQRDYVWSLRDASRFIESLILGLPVPGIFVALERDTNRMLILDGQQRCKTLKYFFDGYFNPRPGAKSKRVFALRGIADRLNGKTYATLSEPDRFRLEEAIIHATIVKQDSPADDDTSIYHVFERLNTGGRKLTPQQIRVAIYHGDLIKLLSRLNSNSHWRQIYGPISKTLKDQELILRFFAMKLAMETYKRPMKEFLNRFAEKKKKISEAEQADWEACWARVCEVVWSQLGRVAFRPKRSLNAALFDAVMVAVDMRLRERPDLSNDDISPIYHDLLEDPVFVERFTRSTADDVFVADRLRIAREALAPPLNA